MFLSISGIVIGASGYPRKNAEVTGVLYDGEQTVAVAHGATDYSGQYFLTFELSGDQEIQLRPDDLRVVLHASAAGDLQEFARDVVWLEGASDIDREIHLLDMTASPELPIHVPMLRAA